MLRFGVVSESVYHLVLIVLFVSSPLVFAALFLIPAPYGRYARSEHGLRARNAWFWMELPAVVVIFLFAVWSRYRSLLLVVFLLMWETHYVYRTFIYSHLMRAGEERRFPLVLAVMAVVFNCLNGYANGYHLYRSDHLYNTSWIYEPRFIFGLLLFFVGLIIHIDSDARLRRLRRKHETSYTVPTGGMFQYVSAPNYFGEIVQWIGWAIATWSLAGLAFAVFTVANLLPRGISHHRWYRDTYDAYPQKRKAIIPFLL